MSRRIFQLLLIAGLATGTAWAAESPFVGQWKLDPARSKLTDEMKVTKAADNKYIFDFGLGPESIVVDGTDQPGGDGTTLSVAARGPGDWKVVRKKDGRVQVTGIWKLSKDSNTLRDHFTGLRPTVRRPQWTMCIRKGKPGPGSPAYG